MRKFLMMCSVAAALVISGCSEDASVENDGSTTDGGGSGYNQGGANGTIDEDGGMTSFNGKNLKSIYFGFDKFVVEGSANVKSLRDSAAIINESGLAVRVEGNADERGNDEYNYALALKRATAVKEMLVSNGIRADIIKLVSFGESKPKCLEQTQECYRENRRVDFKLLSN